MTEEHADLLIANAAEVITCDGPADGLAGEAVRQRELITDGAVAVRGGVILAVGNTAELKTRYRPAQILEADGCLVSPGLVDAHSHLYMPVPVTTNGKKNSLVVASPLLCREESIAQSRGPAKPKMKISSHRQSTTWMRCWPMGRQRWRQRRVMVWIEILNYGYYA